MGNGYEGGSIMGKFKITSDYDDDSIIAKIQSVIATGSLTRTFTNTSGNGKDVLYEFDGTQRIKSVQIFRNERGFIESIEVDLQPDLTAAEQSTFLTKAKEVYPDFLRIFKVL